MFSIVIPIWNQHEMTRECIQVIKENTTDYELVIIDNGSDPPYEGEGLEICNKKNLGFPVAVNQGIQVATGDVIVVMNNDVFVTPSWADILLGWLDKVDIVGPMTNYCAGLQQVNVGVYHDQAELNKTAVEFSKKNFGKSQSVNFVIGFLMAFKKSVYDKIGEFDESLWPCSGEEIDFCFRAREAGYKVAIAQDVYVHHEGSKTFKAMDIDYVKLCNRNDKHLAEKWGKNFWNKQLVFEPNGTRLNLGCGRFLLPGFINIDQFADNYGVAPDVIADAVALSYEKESVDEIYCGHMLEHLTWVDGQNALAHWYDVLKHGGKISICVPDFDILVQNYMANPTADAMRELNDLYIYSYLQPSPHQYMYNRALLEFVMKNTGFQNIEKMPKDHPYFVDSVEWQIGYTGVKP